MGARCVPVFPVPWEGAPLNFRTEAAVSGGQFWDVSQGTRLPPRFGRGPRGGPGRVARSRSPRTPCRALGFLRCFPGQETPVMAGVAARAGPRAPWGGWRGRARAGGELLGAPSPRAEAQRGPSSLLEWVSEPLEQGQGGEPTTPARPGPRSLPAWAPQPPPCTGCALAALSPATAHASLTPFQGGLAPRHLPACSHPRVWPHHWEPRAHLYTARAGWAVLTSPPTGPLLCPAAESRGLAGAWPRASCPGPSVA